MCDREEHNGGESRYPYQYGWLMEGSAKTNQWGRLTNGKRTIMAYQDSNGVYSDGIARFSDNKKYGNEVYTVGNKNNDNHDQIRFAAPFLAKKGDESCTCGGDKCKTCSDTDPRGESFCQSIASWACEDKRESMAWFVGVCQKSCKICTPGGGTGGGATPGEWMN